MEQLVEENIHIISKWSILLPHEADDIMHNAESCSLFIHYVFFGALTWKSIRNYFAKPDWTRYLYFLGVRY